MRDRMFLIAVVAICLLGLLGWQLSGPALNTAEAAWQPPEPGNAQRSSPSITTTIQLPLVLFDAYDCRQMPTLVYPTDGSHLDTIIPLYRWDSGHPAYARSLNLDVSRSPDFSLLDGSMATSDVLEEGSFRFPNNLEPATTYYWRARFFCKNKARGPYTEAWSFTSGEGGELLPAPPLLSPANGSVTESKLVTLTWETVPGANQYIVHWRKVGRSGYTYSWTQNTSLLVRGLEANTAYEWWVNAVTDYAIGEESERWQFTTPASLSRFDDDFEESGRLEMSDDGAFIVR